MEDRKTGRVEGEQMTRDENDNMIEDKGRCRGKNWVIYMESIT